MLIQKRKSQKGFTLVELIVVIAIVGILTVVGLPALFKNIEKAKIAALETDISAIKTATLAYVSENNLIPKNVDNNLNDRSKLGIEDIKKALGDNLENVSNPYKAQYKLHYYPNVDAQKHGAGEYTLWIIMQDQFSEEGTNKIKKDLASMKPTGDEVIRIPGVDEQYNPNSEYWNKGKTVIEVVLIKAKGLSQAK